MSLITTPYCRLISAGFKGSPGHDSFNIHPKQYTLEPLVQVVRCNVRSTMFFGGGSTQSFQTEHPDTNFFQLRNMYMYLEICFIVALVSFSFRIHSLDSH